MPHRKIRLDHHTYIADIPLKIAQKMELQHRETVDITLENDAIVIRKINKMKREPPVPTEGSSGGVYAI